MKRTFLTAFLVLTAVLAFWWLHRGHPRLIVSTHEVTLPADGALHRVTELQLSRAGTLRVENIIAEGPRSRIVAVTADSALAMVFSPVNPATSPLTLKYHGASTKVIVHFVPYVSDRFEDGTPDFMRLHTAEDRLAFRGWFTALAATAAALPPEHLPHEIHDCAALLRWCYRGALHAHDVAWQSTMPIESLPPLPSVEQYSYPMTPLGANLFRVHPGVYQPTDKTNGNFAQFADARKLWQQNTFFVTRNVSAALAGDLLFYRQLEQDSPYHSMILTGREHDCAIYHTGPTAKGPGEVRRVALADLLHYPDSRWRPIPQNANFLGVYRWNILREDLR